MTLVAKDGNGSLQNIATVLNGSSEHQQTFVLPFGQGQTLQKGVINTASSGDNTLVSAVAAKSIYVVSYVLVVTSAVTVQFKDSGPNNLSGAFSLAANGGISAIGQASSPVLWTASGMGLILNLGGAIQVSGHYTYFTA